MCGKVGTRYFSWFSWFPGLCQLMFLVEYLCNRFMISYMYLLCLITMLQVHVGQELHAQLLQVDFAHLFPRAAGQYQERVLLQIYLRI